MENTFNPQGGTNVSELSNVDYNALFTGMVDAKPLCFNPTKEQVVKYKGIPEKVAEQMREPNYKVNMGGKEYTRIELLCVINPNELLDKRDEEGELIKDYSDEHFFNIGILASDEFEQSKAGNFRFINHSNNAAWGKSIEAIQANEKMNWFDTTTARKAKVGEVKLYDLIYNLFSKASTRETPLTNFKIGANPSETFSDIVAGDVSMLNDMIQPDGSAYEYFSHENGEVRKVGVLLGVSIKDDKKYQRVFVNNYCSSFAKEGRSLGKRAIETIEEGHFNANCGSSFDFAVFDPMKLAQEMEDSSPTEIVKDAIADGNEGDFDILDDGDDLL